jgi:hypothetical protein
MRALIAITALLAAPLLQAADAPSTTSAQTIYLPVYSHVYHGERDKNGKPSETLVSTHVSIRNTDPVTSIRIHYARYFDTQGKLVRNYINAPITIPPLGTHEIFIPRSDTAGGSGANFLLAWTSDSPANTPLIEALHADIREARTLMFITSGTPIRVSDPAL